MVTESFAAMFDDAAYGGNASATAGAVSYASPVLAWTGDLAPAASAVITFTVTVHNPDTGDKQVITTAASAAAGSSCPPGTTSSPCQVVVGVLTPALTIVKTASTTTPVPGQQVTYTLKVTDTGQTSYTGASLADPLTGVLDDATYDSDAPATATAGTVSYDGSAVSWTGSLNPADTATITYSVTIDNPDNGDLVLTNTVTSAAAGSNCPASGTDPRCTDHRERGRRGHPDHHRDGRGPVGGGRRGGDLHGHHRELRAEPVCRGERHRAAIGGAG